MPSSQTSDLLVGTQTLCFPTHVYIDKHRQKWERSLFICLGLWRWFSQTKANIPLQLSQEEQNKETSQVNFKFAEAGWASLRTGACGRSTMPSGAAPTHWCHHHVAAPCHPGQWADHKCHFLTPKFRKILNSLFQKSGAVCTGHWHQLEKNIMFINLVKGQLKHKQLNLPTSA